MATTPKGIYYPNDYNEIADIPEDMKKMAESIEEVFEDTDSDLSDIKEEQTTQNNRLNSLEVDNTTNKSDILTNKQEINNIKTEQTEQNTNISTNATNIESLQEENENLKKIVSQLPQVTGQGTEVTLENTIEAPFTKFDVEGNSVQDGSPSPDNEVPIYSAGDNENLFDTSLLPITKNGVTVSKDSKGNVVLNGTPTITTGYIGFDFTLVSTYLKADTYTISVENKINGIGTTINQTTPGGIINLTMSDTAKVKTGTLTADLINGTMGVNVRYDVGTLDNFILNPKLEKGNKASGYSPYGMGSINEKIKNADGTEEQDYSIFVQQPFRSIGDVRDCFVKKSDGKLYERHWIGEVVLNGTEYWELLNSTSDYYEFITYNFLKPVAPSSYTFPMSSHFGNATNNRCVANGNQLLIRVPASMNITNATEFKNWLQENNVTINYLLAEPLDLPCTEEQIQQLENLPSTYKDFTIIQSEDVTKAYLEVSGIYDLNKLITRTEVLESES